MSKKLKSAARAAPENPRGFSGSPADERSRPAGSDGQYAFTSPELHQLELYPLDAAQAKDFEEWDKKRKHLKERWETVRADNGNTATSETSDLVKCHADLQLELSELNARHGIVKPEPEPPAAPVGRVLAEIEKCHRYLDLLHKAPTSQIAWEAKIHRLWDLMRGFCRRHRFPEMPEEPEAVPDLRAARRLIDRAKKWVESLAESIKRERTCHNADFTMVKWYSTEYHFALGIQSSAVKALWEEWERSGLGIHQETIRDAIDPERDSFRMDAAFRNHPAFESMIRRCGDGRYKLAPPATEGTR